MEDYVSQNKRAWEYGTYDYWVRESGTPRERARNIQQNPAGALRKYARYFDQFDGIRVANICGSCGKKAVPLALLGAEVTIFDLSEENRRYALELAREAGTCIGYEVCNVLEIDLDRWQAQFDVVFFEGGILHYFHDLDAFMTVMHRLLRPGGRMICSDFHPYTKIADILQFGQPTPGYFFDDVFEGPMPHAGGNADAPACLYRKYTISQIINSVIGCGFTLRRFDEHPAWTDPSLPGEFTIIATKEVSP